MSHNTRLKFRRLEAKTLNAFHTGFSVLGAVTVASLLAIVALYFLYGTYWTGVLIFPAVICLAEVLLAGVDFLFEFLSGDTTYEQAGVDAPEGAQVENDSVLDEARMVAENLKLMRAARKEAKRGKGEPDE